MLKDGIEVDTIRGSHWLYGSVSCLIMLGKQLSDYGICSSDNRPSGVCTCARRATTSGKITPEPVNTLTGAG